MKTLAYPIEQRAVFNKFAFTSSGPRGEIEKHVEFKWMSRGVYNLSFGDSQGDDFDDLVESNNGDLIRIFATVIEIVGLFLRIEPGVSIFLGGSNAQRRRVYNYVLARNHLALSQKYQIHGQNEHGKWKPYECKKEYAYFLIRKK